MSMVDRPGRKPHWSSGSICCASQKSLRRLATIFSSTLPVVGDEGNPPEVVAVGSVRLLVEHLDRCVFPLLWDFLPSPHTDENGVEMLKDDGFAGGVVQFE